MLGISDPGAFCADVLFFLMLPGLGTVALPRSTAQGRGPAGASAATAGPVAGERARPWLAMGGVSALLAASVAASDAARRLGAACLAGVGSRLPVARGAAARAVAIAPRRDARQAFALALPPSEAALRRMAFFPLVADPAAHRGLPTSAAMAATIAAIPAGCRSALARATERAAGMGLLGVGLRSAPLR